MRYVRHISKIIRGRVAGWAPAPPGAEADGKTYFWSYDPIFETMSLEEEGLGLVDRHGNRQWELVDGKINQKKDVLDADQKKREISRRFEEDYPQDRFNAIMADAEEARMDGAAADDPAFVALKTMQNRKRAIAEEVDGL